MSEEKVLVGRCRRVRPLICAVHGDVSADFLELRDQGGISRLCGRCAAMEANFQPWFYSGSPFGAEISGLCLTALETEAYV